MLRKVKELKGFVLKGKDGEIGRIKDFYFDDTSWAVRYMIADTGKWLALRQVLISPHAVRGFQDSDKRVEVGLTKDQIQNSPPIEQNRPVSRQFEAQYFRYYNYPFYWGGVGIWGALPTPEPGYDPVAAPITETEQNEPPGDPHLRSVDAVTGYYVQALDGEIGHIEDFVLNDRDWVIDYFIVDTVNWWPGKKVLVSPAWASQIDWKQSKVYFNLDHETIKRSPEYDTSSPITRNYEGKLHSHYNQKPHWDRRAAA